jgi:hypothetical protein
MTKPEALGSKQRWLRRFWVVIIAVSGVVGVAAALLDSQLGGAGHERLARSLSNAAPIPQGVAIIFLAALVFTTIASMFYYRTIDEHDRGAQEYASLVGLNLYMFLFFGWGIAAKGGLVPEINHGAVFVAVVATFLVTWLWRRYR